MRSFSSWCYTASGFAEEGLGAGFVGGNARALLAPMRYGQSKSDRGEFVQDKLVLCAGAAKL